MSETLPDAPSVRRRRVRRWVVGAAVGLVVVLGWARLSEVWPFTRPDADIPLLVMAVAVEPDGTRTPLAPDTDLVFLDGSRVAVADPALATPAELAAAQESRDWLASGTVPGAGTEFEDMAVSALLDIHALSLGDGAVVAGWPRLWHNVWPRDNAFVALALARTGHVDEALDMLGFLQDVQSPDGSFQARYTPDGAGPPDDRGIQTDATGWALWAAGAVLAEIDDPAVRVAAAEALRPLVDRSTEHILDLTQQGTRLPPASPDYWEVRTGRLTLGTCAPLVMALTGAPTLLTDLGEPERAHDVAVAAASLDALVRRDFAPDFARYRVGGQIDTAVNFLLPPYAPAQPDVVAAWRTAPEAMARPAGGLAPGASWRKDGVSWTPTTTLFALTAAALGETEAATAWLRWVDDHRTPLGTIPEKVLADGRAASLAPLAWSSANVLLALTYLDGA